MRKLLIMIALVTMATGSVFALNPGQDIIVPAAGRGGPWVTDLYVMNPGSTVVTGSIFWLVRDQGNPSPASISFSLAPGATEILEDVILNDFGQSSAGGAFRVTASAEVIVNSRIYAADGDATFGQGFEGVPTWAATMEGQIASVVGLSSNSSFRTNIYATAGANGATIMFQLLDPSGNVFATKSQPLTVWEPYLKRVDQIFPNAPSFDNATLTAEVNAGAAVVGASKVDNISTDPTTLESSAAGGGGIDGTYQFSLYDQLLFASGGNIEISGGQVTAINGTYFNWDKLDDDNFSVCTNLFLWGNNLIPASVGDFADGVTFADTYLADPDSDPPFAGGTMTYTVEFEPGEGSTLVGSVTAVGSEFSGADALCNGDFPPLVFMAGKGVFPQIQ